MTNEARGEHSRAVEITLSIDRGLVRSYSDEFLAFAWHLVQHNPAPHGDRVASELVEAIGWEIVRRWLGGVAPEMYRHQPKAYYWQELTRFARYEPPAGVPATDPAWGSGRWVVRQADDEAGGPPMSTQTAQRPTVGGTGTEQPESGAAT